MSRAEERRQAREAGGSDMTKFYMLFGAVAVIGVGVVGYNVSSSMLGEAVTAPVELDVEGNEQLVEIARGVTKGDADAQITIVEFGDFQCPSCAAFAQQVKPQIDLSMVETGDAKFVFYDYPLVSIHANSFFAARAARCAEDQGKFWEYQDELFRNQARWSAQPNPGGAFGEYAETLGLDQKDFNGCLNSDRHAELVTANMQLAQVMGATGTPTILVNIQGKGTRRTQGFDYQSIATTIQQMQASTDESN